MSKIKMYSYKCNKCESEFEGDAGKSLPCIECGGTLIRTGTIIAEYDLDGNRVGEK
jgi:DNA-directed RNA polymerase subunit RPC12/RpoP